MAANGAVNGRDEERKQEEKSPQDMTARSATAVDSKNEAPSRAVSYFGLYRFADGLDYLYIFLGTIGAIVDGLLLPIVVALLMQVVNSFASSNTQSEHEVKNVKKYIKIITIVSPAIGGLAFLEAACWMRAGERQALRIRSLYLRAVLRQNEGFFDTKGASAADVVNSVSSETSAIQEAISEKVGTFIAYVAAFLGAVGLSLYFTWELGLIWLAATPILLTPGIIYGRKLGTTAKAMGMATRVAGNVAGQAISSINTVYSFVGENQVLRKYSQNLTVIVDLGAKMGIYKSIAIGTSAGGYAVWALIFWVGSRLVIHKGVKGAYVINGGFLVLQGIIGVGAAFRLIQFFADGCRVAGRIFEVIDRVPEIDNWDSRGKVLEKLEGTLELRSIHFAYPARPKAKIFEDFSITIPAGCKVALVGNSGSGKSTVIALLERFYDPISGEVLIDGINIKELQLRWVRTQIGLVSQEPALFATTIKQNIMLGKDNATLEDVIQAAKKSNAHNFIDQLPDKYETQVGERGVKMSGGQKQRIAIARAILKNPPILLLDEATSALDADSEKVVQDALDSVSVGRTTVVVAHRLSTIRNADLIAVIKDGQVVELGTHSELSSAGGPYADLVHLQQTRTEFQEREEDNEISGPVSRRRSDSLSKRTSFELSFPRSSSLRNSVNRRPSADAIEDEVTVRKPTAPSFRKLLAINRPEWKQAVLGTLGAAGAGSLQPATTFVVGSMLSALYDRNHHELTEKVKKYCGIFVGLSVAAMIFSFLQHYNFQVMGEKLTKRLREMLLTKILTFEVGWYDDDENSSGVICARLATEANMARALVSDRMSLLLQTGSTMLVCAVVTIIISWKLALVLLSVQPIVIVSFLAKGQVLKLMFKNSVKAQEDSSQVASEAVSHHRTVAAFCAEGKVVDIFDTLQASPEKVKQSKTRAVVAGLGLGGANTALIWTWAFSLWWAQTLLHRGDVGLTALFRVLFMVIATGRVIGETGSVATDLARGSNSIVKVFNLLDRQTLIDSDNSKGKKVENVDGFIELKNVDFAYPTRPDVQVFKKLNLKVSRGRNIALVGKSGSGKSTIVSLIERFYDPIKGTITIDGIDIRTLHLKTLRLHISLVSQEPVLFDGTIQENIQYGRENATQGEIIEAAKAANAYNFICSLKDGFETNTGDRGLQLSGGQKQRIAIARAILKNPSILLLDEATSALDAQSEKVVQDALDKVMVGRTTIIVAHRLSTVQNCDSIVVIQDGAVCEQGRHDELLSKGGDGAYSALVRLQQRNE